MGQQVLLDIAGSFVIGGVLFLTILTFTTRNYETKVKIRDEGATIKEIKNTMEIIEEDFRRIGYCALPSKIVRPIITIAKDNQIKFKTDELTSNTSVGNLEMDYIEYKLEGKNAAAVNPNAKRLVRYVRDNNDNIKWRSVFSVTKFNLKYYDSFGKEITPPITGGKLEEIRFVGLEIEIENDYPLRSSDNLNNFVTAVSSWKQLYIAIQNFGIASNTQSSNQNHN
jgi:hypothetical protein